MTSFEPLSADLNGTHLIEASAGTGKTYTITALFLRLLLEKGEDMEVGNILVVTFTDAATEELKDRIRSRLRELADALAESPDDEEAASDPFLAGLIRNLTLGREDALRRVTEAVHNFDEAAIFTIHGFCRRMLRENAFESGTAFDTELAADMQNLRREIVDDYRRIHFHSISRLFFSYAQEKISPDALYRFADQISGHPDIRLIPETEVPENVSECETAYRETWEALRREWERSAPEIISILLTDKGLNRTYFRVPTVESKIRLFEDRILQTDPPFNLSEFKYFSADYIRRNTKKKCTAPEHPFFEIFDTFLSRNGELTAAFDAEIRRHRTALHKYLKKEMKRRKEVRNIQSFNDLLVNLRDALRGPAGKPLKERIRSRFRAALIDEFQDTDPVQYEIFRTLFQKKESAFFLIGDPKQAIYGFRGADIFAYLEASRTAENKHPLDRNWRSEPGLITAVNALFQNADRAFLYDEIPFLPVFPGEKTDRPELTLNGKKEPPMIIWTALPEEQEGKGKPISKGDVSPMFIRAAAAEISRLITLGSRGKALIGGIPLVPGDIAVLVRKNREAEAVKEALSGLAVPAVIHSTGDIFDTHEAGETARVLSALARPRNRIRIRSALATDIMGMSGNELDTLSDDNAAWEEWLVKFGEYHRTWERRGFIRMYRRFLHQERVLPRLMAYPDGERRCTNIQHLAEQIHRADAEKRPGMTGLIQWLNEQRLQPGLRQEETPLRLESDEKAVRIVTVHKSKGLEYPVVFCPFIYDGLRKTDSDDSLLFHDGKEDRRMTLDLGSDDWEAHRALAREEAFAENLRLFYVAATRAKNRCYLAWGRINQAGDSAPARLFHGPEMAAENVIRETVGRFTKLSNADFLADMERIRERAEGNIAVIPLPREPGLPCPPPADDARSLKARTFVRRISDDFRISSFSSLISGGKEDAERADRDGLIRHATVQEPAFPKEAEPEAPHVRRKEDIFSFPRGARAGTCLHEIFEHVDFTKMDADAIQTDVSECLDKYHYKPMWVKPVAEMVRRVLNKPILPGTPDFSLSRLPLSERIHEMEFYFPVRALSPNRLASVFRKHGTDGLPEAFPEQMESLSFSPSKGFVKGFIDLIFRWENRFYLIDWKSNHLGDRSADYHQSALSDVMKTDFYILQYMIYTLAVHRYLGTRLPDYDYETHFGGIIYVFLRGVDAETGADFGLFRDRPPAPLIHALSEQLIG